MSAQSCTAAPTITPVGPMLHVECPRCSTDYYVPRLTA